MFSYFIYSYWNVWCCIFSCILQPSWSIILFKYLILQLFSSCLSSSPVFISPPLTDQYNQLWSPGRASRLWIIDRGIILIRSGGGQREKERFGLNNGGKAVQSDFSLSRNIKHQRGESKRNRKSDYQARVCRMSPWLRLETFQQH